MTDTGTITRTPGTETAVLAGGCFWDMEDLIRRQPGVRATRVGYTGGENANATYRNHPGHAEAVEIVFDPTETTYRDILAFFFQIHDPSTLDRQGNDVGVELSLRDLPAEPRAGAGRPRHDRRRGCLGPLAGRRGHHDRARGCVLGGRARAPGLPAAHPERLHLPLPPRGLGAAAARRLTCAARPGSAAAHTAPRAAPPAPDSPGAVRGRRAPHRSGRESCRNDPLRTAGIAT